MSKTVWAVSNGKYSEYGVTAIYSTEEKAAYVAYIKNRKEEIDPYFVEEFDFDPDDDSVGPIPEMVNGIVFQFPRSPKGKVITRERDESRPVGAERLAVGTYRSVEIFVPFVNGERDYARAEKIAYDQYAEYMAHKEGIA